MIRISVLVALTLLVPTRAFAQVGDPEAGREVFEANCAMCHGSDASGMMGIHPSLRGAVERLTLEGVEVTVLNGRDTSPPMPSFGGRLSEEELDDVVAYLDTLPVGPRNFGAEDGGMMGMDGMMDGGMWYWLAWIALFLVVLSWIIIASVFVTRALWKRDDGRRRVTHPNPVQSEHGFGRAPGALEQPPGRKPSSVTSTRRWMAAFEGSAFAAPSAWMQKLASSPGEMSSRTMSLRAPSLNNSVSMSCS